MALSKDTNRLIQFLGRDGGFQYLWTNPQTKPIWFKAGNLPQPPKDWKNVYFSVNPGIFKLDGYKRGTIDNVAVINCLFAEFDIKHGWTIEKLEKIDIKPNIIISSGGGWHTYFLLTGSQRLNEKNRETIKKLQYDLVTYCGGDPDAKDITRVLRLPGSLNYKYDPPRPVEFIKQDYDNLYSLSDLSFLIPETENKQETETKENIKSGLNFNIDGGYWLDKALDRLGNHGRNDTGFFLACQLRDNGMSEHEARGVMLEYQNRVPAKDHKYTEKEALDSLEMAYSGGKRDPARSARNGAYMSNTQPTPPPPDNDEFWEEIEKGTTELKILPAVERVKIKPVESSQNEMINYVPGKALTDLGNAERLITLYGADLKYSNELKNFLTWSGARWVEDNDGQARRLAQNTAKTILIESYNEEDKSLSKKIGQWAFTSQSKNKLDSMLDLAKSQPGITVPITEFDRNEYKLNFLNGTLDLTTGTLQPHNPLDLITKQIQLNYDPDAECPLWLKFLDEIMDHDQDLINYLQRSIGYSLTGDTGEQCLFVAHGNGSNGKTVFTQTILKALGDDYTKTARPETILTKDRSSGGATPDLARLRGARYVSINEIASSRRLDEARVKEMTGSDQITARFLFSEEFSYTPSFKLWISTNHKPIIKDVDEGIWRRMRLIPFTVKIPENKQDIKLIQKLESEYAGIIAWAVQGCLQWQESGLQTPEKVTQATELYRTEEDLLQPFFDDKCVIDENIKTMASDLYKSYKAWCEENSEKATNTTRFGRMLSDRGFEKTRLTAGNFWQGIGLRE